MNQTYWSQHRGATARSWAVLLLVIAMVAAFVLSDATRVSSEMALTAIPTGTDPLEMQLTPDGAKLLVSNAAANNVSIISTTSDTVVATVQAGTNPGPIRITPDGTRAYVVNELSNNVTAINVTTNSFITNVGVGSNPITLSRTDDGAKVYVANKGSNNVSVICTGLVPAVCSSSNSVIGSPITVGTGPNVMAKTPDGSKLYVANETSNSVSVIALTGGSSDTVVATIPLAPSQDPGSIHFLPNGTKAYIANRGCVAPATGCPSISVAPSISVINVATSALTTTITDQGLAVGDAPHSMRITPDGSKLYVVNKHGDDVMVVNTGTDAVLRYISLPLQGSCTNISFGVGSCPVRIELTPDGSKAYVVEERPLASQGALTAICTGVVPSVCGGASTDTVLNSTLVGSSPTDIEIEGGIKAYVSNSLSNNVSVVALLLDSDGDGCPDANESQTAPGTQLTGGQRNPNSFWDYFDTPDNSNVRDHKILVSDVTRVINRFRANDNNGTAPINRNSDPLAMPPSAPAYSPAFDRGNVIGPHLWNLGPPDGQITVADVVEVVNQYRNNCAP